MMQAKNYTKGRSQPIRAIVLHTMECSEVLTAAENVGSWFAGTNAPKASAHYGVDADSTVQYVADSDTAWHAGPVNAWTIGIEMAGAAKQSPADWADSYSDSMIRRVASLIHSLSTLYDIPIIRLTGQDVRTGRGIFGHHDVTRAWGKVGGHWDPGPSFPWSTLFNYINTLRGIDTVTYTLPEVVVYGSDWVRVVSQGVAYDVAPDYIYPVGIGEAIQLAEAAGCVLPNPTLVDSIWQAADLRVAPVPWPAPATMQTTSAYMWHAAQVGKQLAGQTYHLLAGTHKDVCMTPSGVAIYGWHTLGGKPIQPPFRGHSLTWRDYSQGLRLVRPVPTTPVQVG